MATKLTAILLLNPPVTKPCEPPAGLARLAGALADHGVGCEVVDLNLICLLEQFAEDFGAADRWSRRAWKNRHRNLAEIRSAELYRTADRYRRVVSDLGRVLAQAGNGSGCEITLANFSDRDKSPLASSDLLASAEEFAQNHFFPSFASVLHKCIDSCRPDWVGISLSYLSQALTGFAIAGFLRHHYPHIKIVAGGGLLSTWMSGPNWNAPFAGLIDHCLDGPGEEKLLRLLGQHRETKLGRFDYDDFAGGGYFAPGAIIGYASSSGCYWKKCSFCPDAAEGSCYLALPPSTAIDQIHDLVAGYHPLLLHLLDNAVSPALLRQLATSPPGVSWYGFARFEKDLEDFDFCLSLKRAGCVMLKLGLESGSQQVLEAMHKGISLERAAVVLDNLKRAGIATYVYLLFGTPAETQGEALQTLNFVRCHAEAITFLNLAIFNMPVCSAEAAELKTRFSDGDLSLYCDFSHPAGWGRKAVRIFLQKEFRKDPQIRKIELRNPGVFGSNHAPFFVR